VLGKLSVKLVADQKLMGINTAVEYNKKIPGFATCMSVDAPTDGTMQNLE